MSAPENKPETYNASESGENAKLSPSGFLQAKSRSFDQKFVPFVPARVAARSRMPSYSSRILLYCVCLAFILFMIWAALAEIDEVVPGSGQIVPSQRVQHIQNLEGGIMREILVREGQIVEKGDLLLRIDNEQAGSALRDAVTRALELEATIARLEAKISGTEPQYPEEVRVNAPDIIVRHNDLLAADRRKMDTERKALEAQLEARRLDEQEQLEKQRGLAASLELSARQRDLAKKLLASKSYSEMEYLNLERQVNTLRSELKSLASTIPKTRAAIREAEEKLALQRAGVETESLAERNKARAELATLREMLTAGADRVTRTEVRSPVRGVIKSIRITTGGGVIMPGEVIMDVVPVDDTLIVEARIRPQDVAFVFVGQKARVRLTAYDFAIYGSMKAVLEHVSADTIEGQGGELFYLVKLRTESGTLEHNGVSLPIMPGMMASVDIITGKKTVLDYILKPILRARQNALRER